MSDFVGKIAELNDGLNQIVWGAPALILIIGVGIYYTIRSGAFQFRHFGLAMKNTVGRISEKRGEEIGEGEVSPMQAISTALAGAFGVGNIAGVTSAITIGGPGAIFWMVLSALVGMMTKFAEIFLSISYRQRNDEGDWVGGPMYYIKNGLKKHWHWLATFFALAACFAALGTGNAVQVGNISDALQTAVQEFVPNIREHTDIFNAVVGIILMLIVGFILIGGIQRIGQAAESVVPPMAIIYSLFCLIAILANFSNIGNAFRQIFVGAFEPAAVFGGLAGATMRHALEFGVKRGVFSNEAGLGTGPMAHAASTESNPVKQAFFAILEVGATILVCLLNGLLVVACLSPETINYGVEGTTSLNAQALATVFGGKIGSIIVAIALALFAFTTIIGWGLYGIRCAEFVFGIKAKKFYTYLYIVTCFVGATAELGVVWGISDTMNGLMIIPNCLALLLLSGQVNKGIKDYLKEQKEAQALAGKQKTSKQA